ncbi:interleukin-22 receptor subunit alpha-2 [Gouania willdenowi]|uniref:Interleukin-22 receptor subunit alpha-2-like n=1 Tax=Gouania willdenowi TaxID=441366 RepID=A0A8C5HQR1_GOUWI|nr:interleukin-22 receptor subunit alpha-2-like [Gouania willdenowi]
MKTLLLGSFLLGNLGLFVPAHDVVAPPTQVRFDSVDYRNILHWTPPINASSRQFYVQWKIYGEPQWLDVDGCQGITEHLCDLSRVTSTINEWYYARVRASASRNSSTWSSSPRFSPRWDTKISPPTLKLKMTKQGIMVRVKPTRVLLKKIPNNLLYKVYLKHSNGDEEVFEMSSCCTKWTLPNMTHGTQYCLQAQTVVLMQSKRSARSPLVCVTTL